MLAEIREQYKGQFSARSVLELEQMEQELLHYASFGSKEALALGTEIVKQSEKYGEEMVIRITRLADGATLFQYIGDTRSERNIGFAQAKGNAVRKTGHCSLWTLAQEETVGGVDAVFAEDSNCLPAGGAFPIYEGENMTAVLATSGLHNGNDHRAVVEALCAIQGKSIPPYSGIMV